MRFGRRTLGRAASMLAPLSEAENELLRSSWTEVMGIGVPPGEQYWMGVDVQDWVRRQLPGATPDMYQCKLFPTSHRLLVCRRSAVEKIVDYDECEPFGYRRLGRMGFITASAGRWSWKWYTHWAAADTLVALMNELRELHLQ